MIDPTVILKNQHMKSKLVKLAFLVILAIGAGSMSASAQVYVSVHPVWHPVARRPAGPRGAVWIDEDWVIRNGHYVSVGGRWGVPPHPGYVWIPGRWVRERRGEYWVA